MCRPDDLAGLAVKHDVVQVLELEGEVHLTCACGKLVVGRTKAKADEAHLNHFLLETARDQLPKEDDDE